jgi:hypothetical protein
MLRMDEYDELNEVLLGEATDRSTHCPSSVQYPATRCVHLGEINREASGGWARTLPIDVVTVSVALVILAVVTPKAHVVVAVRAPVAVGAVCAPERSILPAVHIIILLRPKIVRRPSLLVFRSGHDASCICRRHR